MEEIKKSIVEFVEKTSPQDIKKKIANMQKLILYYRCALKEVETKFRVLNDEFSMLNDRNPITDIQTRIKSPESIAEKCQRKGVRMTAEDIEKNIFDIAGIRIVCSFISDIYMLTDCLASQDDITVIEKQDYIENPKSNGYRSLHLLVKIPIFLKDGKRDMIVEVQLRTIAMEFWANIEHQLRYKKHLSQDVLKAITGELSESALVCEELDKKMQAIRNVVEIG